MDHFTELFRSARAFAHEKWLFGAIEQILTVQGGESFMIL